MPLMVELCMIRFKATAPLTITWQVGKCDKQNVVVYMQMVSVWLYVVVSFTTSPLAMHAREKGFLALIDVGAPKGSLRPGS